MIFFLNVNIIICYVFINITKPRHLQFTTYLILYYTVLEQFFIQKLAIADLFIYLNNFEIGTLRFIQLLYYLFFVQTFYKIILHTTK